MRVMSESVKVIHHRQLPAPAAKVCVSENVTVTFPVVTFDDIVALYVVFVVLKAEANVVFAIFTNVSEQFVPEVTETMNLTSSPDIADIFNVVGRKLMSGILRYLCRFFVQISVPI